MQTLFAVQAGPLRKDCRAEDPPPSFRRVAQFAATHDIECCELTPRPEAEVGDTLLFCKTCAQYATSKPKGLGEVCPAYNRADWRGGESAQHKLRRVLKGLHPQCGRAE